MKIKRILASAGLVATVAFACSQNNTAKETARVTEEKSSLSENVAAAVTLPAFTMQDVQGKAVPLQSLKGKKVFVNLWASWCPPCRREMPSIEKLAKGVDTSKVAFVLLSLDESFDKAKAFAKRQGLSMPVYYPAEGLPPLLNVQSIPTTFIFDERGELIKGTDGGDDYDTPAYRKMLQ